MKHDVLALFATLILGSALFFAIYYFLDRFRWWTIPILMVLILVSAIMDYKKGEQDDEAEK